MTEGTEVTGNGYSEQERQLLQTSFRVMSGCCVNCLFGPHKLVSDIRKEVMLAKIVHNDGFFICHEASERGQTICCRGFYERYKMDVGSLRVAQILERLFPGSLCFVQPVEDGETTISALEEEA